MASVCNARSEKVPARPRAHLGGHSPMGPKLESEEQAEAWGAQPPGVSAAGQSSGPQDDLGSLWPSLRPARAGLWTRKGGASGL